MNALLVVFLWIGYGINLYDYMLGYVAMHEWLYVNVAIYLSVMSMFSYVLLLEKCVIWNILILIMCDWKFVENVYLAPHASSGGNANHHRVAIRDLGLGGHFDRHQETRHC
jgi:hypothetical protein